MSDQLVATSEESYAQVFEIDNARNEVMLALAELRNIPLDETDATNQFQDAMSLYIESALVQTANMEPDERINFLVDEAVKRRDAMSLAGVNIESQLSDMAYRDKYLAYTVRELMDTSTLSLSDILLISLNYERSIFRELISDSRSNPVD